MNIIQANKAVKKLRIGLYGHSGKGKTHTALLMATALGARTLVIDSEDGASHNFSDLTNFAVLQLKTTSIDSYIEAVEEAVKHADKFDTVIIDSMTHAWQWCLQEVAKERNTQLGWGKVGPRWDRLFHTIKRLQTHVIVTFRSKTRQDGNNWVETWDSRENSDYDFDMILKMLGTKSENNTVVSKAEVEKCRFNTGSDKLSVGKTVNAGAGLMTFILNWQRQQVATQQGDAENERQQTT